jgi:hypothetical protein
MIFDKFFKKKADAQLDDPLPSLENRIRHILRLHEFHVAASFFKFDTEWSNDDESRPVFSSHVHMPRRAVGVVHEHFHEDQLFRARIDFLKSHSRVKGNDKAEIGSVRIDKAEPSLTKRLKQELPTKIDSRLSVDVTLNDPDGQMFSQVKQSMRDCEGSNNFHHISFRLPRPTQNSDEYMGEHTIDEYISELTKLGYITIPIVSVYWETKFILPRAPRWSWEWDDEL